jgi:hypothetical protein
MKLTLKVGYEDLSEASRAKLVRSALEEIEYMFWNGQIDIYHKDTDKYGHPVSIVKLAQRLAGFKAFWPVSFEEDRVQIEKAITALEKSLNILKKSIKESD